MGKVQGRVVGAGLTGRLSGVTIYISVGIVLGR
jgi:hypothetical protein